MVEAGIDDLFVANTIAGPDKIRAHRRTSPRGAASEWPSTTPRMRTPCPRAAGAAGSTLGVMIEVDTGMDRAGVDDGDAALALARHLMDLPNLRLDGITGYEGHCSLTPERDLRLEKQRAAMALFTGVADRLIARRHPREGPLGRRNWYVGMDGFPSKADGSPGRYLCGHGHVPRPHVAGVRALADCPGHGHQPSQHGHVIVDAGNKSMGAGGPRHDRRLSRTSRSASTRSTASSTPRTTRPCKVGDSVALVPGYSPGTVNWYDAYHVVKDDLVVDIWPVVPRGPGHNGLLAS